MSQQRKVRRQMARKAMEVAGIQHPNRKMMNPVSHKRESIFQFNWRDYIDKPKVVTVAKTRRKWLSRKG